MGIFSRRKPHIKAVTVSEMRQSLLDDKAVFLAIIVGLIKKHRKTLESKFEQYIEHDEYGNVLVNTDFKSEIVYFSDKVVLPELERCIEGGKTNYKDLVLILAGGITDLADEENMPMDITYEDSDQAIVSKLLSATNRSGDDSLINDDILRQVHDNNIAARSELKSVATTIMEIRWPEPYFGKDIEAHGPMCVTYFAASIFNIFSVMYNNQDLTCKIRLRKEEDFTGNDPYKYEEYIKTLLQDEGFRAKRTKGSGDFGVDVIASRNGKTYAIQCKLYNHTVGAKAVQEIAVGRMHYRTDFAVVVSDNSYTDSAKSLARTTGVILAHHNDLLHKIERLDVNTKEKHIDDTLDRLEKSQPTASHEDNTAKAKRQWTQDDTGELITVVLPTIRNDE